MHRGRVVAVDQPAGHAVSDRLVGEGRRGGLLGQRHGDREAVVLDEEDHRRLPDGREIQRLVEVALARAAVADHGQRHHVVALEAGGVRQAHGMRELGGERGAQRGDAVFVRVVAGVPVAAQQGQRLRRGRGRGRRRRGCRGSWGRASPASSQGQRGGDLAGLLAGGGRVDRQACPAGSARWPARCTGGRAPAGVYSRGQQAGVEPGGGVRAQQPVRLRVGQQRRGVGARPPGGRRAGQAARVLLLPGCSRTVMASTSSDRRGGAMRLMWVVGGRRVGRMHAVRSGFALPYRLFGR